MKIMVTAQRPPEKSTLMADYDTWKKVGRYVKRGAKGCAIFPSRALNPRMAYFYSVVDSTNSTGENAAPVNNTEYAFQLEIDTSKALPESLKIFNIQRVGVAVWNTERSKIISQMNLYKPEDLLKEI